MMMKTILALILICSFSGCYRMPTDEDYCLNPNVNNPDITREKCKNPFAPGAAF